MHENIENKITELKEIALQIMNIVQDKQGSEAYAYNYLKAIANDEVSSRAVYYRVPKYQAYETQLLFCLDNLNYWRGHEAKAYKDLLKLYLEYFQGKKDTARLNQDVNPLWGMIRGIGD
jgi:hypothetical protein